MTRCTWHTLCLTGILIAPIAGKMDTAFNFPGEINGSVQYGPSIRAKCGRARLFPCWQFDIKQSACDGYIAILFNGFFIALDFTY